MSLPADNHLISISHVWLVRDSRVILEDIDLHVDTGDLVAITGPNGGGKTSLLRIILGLLHPSKGKVEVAPGISIGYLPQKNHVDSHFPVSVREVVESGLLASKGLTAGERSVLVDRTLRSVDMLEHAERPIGRLSGGQLQRALLGRAIISSPQLLVLDEPLSYIDKRFEAHLYDLIKEIAAHATILLVSHEMSTIAGMASRHLIIDRTLHECKAPHHYVRTECDD